MPPEGDKLSDDRIKILIRWIDGGLLENKSSSARKPTKPRFESTLRSDPAAKPDGPPPMPEHLLLEPTVVTSRPSSIHAIAASPWGPLLAVTGQRQVLLYHTESLELIGILPFPEGEPTALDSEGKRAFIADSEGTVRIFQTADAKSVGEIQANPPTIATRLASLAARSAQQEQTIAAAGKISEPAPEELAKAKSTLMEINAARNHWTAAAINATAITTRHQAEESALAIDDQQNQFLKSAAHVAIESNALNLKRSQ